MNKKADFELDTIMKLLLVLIILLIIIGIIYLLKNQSLNILDKIREMLRFR